MRAARHLQVINRLPVHRRAPKKQRGAIFFGHLQPIDGRLNLRHVRQRAFAAPRHVAAAVSGLSNPSETGSSGTDLS